MNAVFLSLAVLSLTGAVVRAEDKPPSIDWRMGGGLTEEGGGLSIRVEYNKRGMNSSASYGDASYSVRGLGSARSAGLELQVGNPNLRLKGELDLGGIGQKLLAGGVRGDSLENMFINVLAAEAGIEADGQLTVQSFDKDKLFGNSFATITPLLKFNYVYLYPFGGLTGGVMSSTTSLKPGFDLGVAHGKEDGTAMISGPSIEAESDMLISTGYLGQFVELGANAKYTYDILGNGIDHILSGGAHARFMITPPNGVMLYAGVDVDVDYRDVKAVPAEGALLSNEKDNGVSFYGGLHVGVAK